MGSLVIDLINMSHLQTSDLMKSAFGQGDSSQYYDVIRQTNTTSRPSSRSSKTIESNLFNQGAYYDCIRQTYRECPKVKISKTDESSVKKLMASANEKVTATVKKIDEKKYPDTFQNIQEHETFSNKNIKKVEAPLKQPGVEYFALTRNGTPLSKKRSKAPVEKSLREKRENHKFSNRRNMITWGMDSLPRDDKKLTANYKNQFYTTQQLEKIFEKSVTLNDTNPGERKAPNFNKKKPVWR